MPRKIVKCATQKELDAALEDSKACDIWLVGDGRFVVRTVPDNKSVSAREKSNVEAWGSSHVVAWGSSHVVARESSHVEAWGSSHVEAWGSSHVEARESSHVEARGSSHVEAWESSHVEARGSSHVEARESSHVEAWESSHVEARESSHVEAWESSHVEAWESSHVEAWGSSHVEAWGSSHVEARGSCSISASGHTEIQVASKLVVAQRRAQTVTVTGEGVVIDIPPITTAEQWCEYYGVSVTDGVATLYKAVRADFASGHDTEFFWTPGTRPSVPHMDDRECGLGLHFVPHPSFGLQFYSASDVRFVACPVALADMRVTPSDQAGYPMKVKAQRVAGPVWECDRYGKAVMPIEATK
jgi:hypothetical protein